MYSDWLLYFFKLFCLTTRVLYSFVTSTLIFCYAVQFGHFFSFKLRCFFAHNLVAPLRFHLPFQLHSGLCKWIRSTTFLCGLWDPFAVPSEHDSERDLLERQERGALGGEGPH